MLTSKDIDKILAIVASKQDIQAVNARLDRMDITLRGMMTGIDKLATSVEKMMLEYAAVSEQLTRHERWIKQIAKKAGIALVE